MNHEACMAILQINSKF